MMRRLSLMSAFAVLLALAGCDVHEFPDVESTTFTLHLEFDTDMPLYREIVHTRAAAVNDATAYDVRHAVSLHRLHADGTYDRTADTIVVFGCDDVSSLDCTRELVLPEGLYNIFVWTDYTDARSLTDKYYDTTDFSEIILNGKENYVGSCDYRGAFRGTQKILVAARRDGLPEIGNEATVQMTRPLARFQFVSTDYDEFVENALRAEAQRKERDASDAGDGADTRSMNPDDYRVVFRYTGFVPCSYNMFTDKPADSWTGVSFEGSLTQLAYKEVELGSDFVFVNGAEAGVSVMLEVYYRDGTLIASSPSIDVPLKRGHLTVVKGEFLTSVSDGGVNINSKFEDDYNIEIR